MLDNPRSPRVRAIAKLAKRNARQDTGLFLLEGPQAVAEALTYRPELVVELYATPTAVERYTSIAQTAVDAGVEVQFVTEDVLASMADTVTPQGVLAVVHQFPTSLRNIFATEPRLVVVLEEVRDPGNLGTIIRAADAAGADAVVLTGRTVDLYNPKVVRSTTGSLFHIPIAVGAEVSAVIERAKSDGLRVVAADIKGESLLAARASGELAAPTVWIFGNETHGLPDELLPSMDSVISVPIFGHAESMNLATAASVCLYESAFAQRATETDSVTNQ